VRYPTFFGIDLTSTEAKPSACLGLDDKSQTVYLGFLTKNTDITALLNLYLPLVVAIDAPLSLPAGLCCLEENCPCQPRSSRKNRQCDRELRQLGIPCYPTSKKTFVKDLIYRGIELKTSIGRQTKQATQVIEVYPFASKVRLFGQPIPPKTTKQGLYFLRQKLGEVLPGLKPYLDMFDHDLCDAAVAAHTALLYHQNKVEALGNSEEGLIFIPAGASA
jgi:predicted nuclease with RNAse H fold